MARFYLEEKTMENLIAVTFVWHINEKGENQNGAVIFKKIHEIPYNAKIIEVFEESGKEHEVVSSGAGYILYASTVFARIRIFD